MCVRTANVELGFCAQEGRKPRPAKKREDEGDRGEESGRDVVRPAAVRVRTTRRGSSNGGGGAKEKPLGMDARRRREAARRSLGGARGGWGARSASLRSVGRRDSQEAKTDGVSLRSVGRQDDKAAPDVEEEEEEEEGGKKEKKKVQRRRGRLGEGRAR